MDNQTTYASGDVIAHYLRQENLFAAEAALLAQWEQQLPSWRVLDLGVGGGRTTPHLASRAGEYIGTDYIPAMVAACRQKFPLLPFETADARSMPQFADKSFDFVLFSFNGIDYIGPDDRLLALAEIRRILKPGGLFAFSSHNLEHAEKLGTFRWTFSPKKLVRRLGRLIRFYQAGGKKLLARDWALLNDGTFSGRLMTHYIKPDVQRRQLEQAGFTPQRILDPQTGSDVTPPRPESPWLYYVCQRTHT